ncbi:DUF488 domain-containing protein [Candidatus Marsarchaeota archaeon]|nr:DUF488 domain-containing protein [Candidatus Marsarchaeota archaeon]MCL5100157.1 DUF488 domain-containing protein [Candidatus Marsarchaeota archaeon]
MLQLKRVYEKAEIRDGTRILVDRLWPRGIRRSTATVDLWMKNVAPSKELRKWFLHDPAKWQEFKKRYRAELRDSRAFLKLVEIARTTDPLTLLYAARDTKRNNAVVLMSMLKQRLENIRLHER